MDTELTNFLGRDKYEHGSKDGNHRNGSYSRQFCVKGIGDVELKIPRDRHGEFQTALIERGQRYEAAIAEDMALMYLTGISTRNLSLLSHRLIGRKLSHEEISTASRGLTGAVEKWRCRDLSNEVIKYLFVDGKGVIGIRQISSRSSFSSYENLGRNGLFISQSLNRVKL